MEGLYELTNALSNRTIRDFIRPPFPQDWGFASPTQNCNLKLFGYTLLTQEQVKLWTSNLADTFIGSI